MRSENNADKMKRVEYQIAFTRGWLARCELPLPPKHVVESLCERAESLDDAFKIGVKTASAWSEPQFLV